ncbi:MAG: cardiolipin synthase ClsB [Polaromonas sp.]
MKPSRQPDKRARHVAENLRLFQGGREYFPALIEAIDGAAAWMQMETYLFDIFGAGADVANALIRAAQRGVTVQVLVDGIGSHPLPPEWQEKMRSSGVQWCVYSPLASSWSLLRPLAWRRLHRKLCVIDQHRVFCGGINVLDDFYDPNHGALTEPRFDFAISATGPLAIDAAEAVTLLWWRVQAGYSARQRHLSAAWEAFKAAGYGGRTTAALPPASPAQPGSNMPVAHAALVLRDNLRNRSSIEKSYLKAIGHARADIVIANAYFLPGGKLRRALIGAARRGVKVTVLLQGRYEYFMQYHASRPVFDALLKEGIEIHAYAKSFLHAKVAVIDGHWATVGSSNLDPLSLLLAREANVVIEGAAFANELRDCLLGAVALQDGRIDPLAHSQRPVVKRMLDWFAYGVMRVLLWVTGKRY